MYSNKAPRRHTGRWRLLLPAALCVLPILGNAGSHSVNAGLLPSSGVYIATGSFENVNAQTRAMQDTRYAAQGMRGTARQAISTYLPSRSVNCAARQLFIHKEYRDEEPDAYIIQLPEEWQLNTQQTGETDTWRETEETNPTESNSLYTYIHNIYTTRNTQTLRETALCYPTYHPMLSSIGASNAPLMGTTTTTSPLENPTIRPKQNDFPSTGDTFPPDAYPVGEAWSLLVMAMGYAAWIVWRKKKSERCAEGGSDMTRI